MLYTVGEMAKRLGVAASTLRYYDKEGLLPFVERSDGGMRMFKENDFGWLKIISCLKKTGMPLKSIKEYIKMSMIGDDSLDARLAIFQKQREVVTQQAAEINKALALLNYKCWFYETAIAGGSSDIPRNMPLEELPEEFRAVKKSLNSSSHTDGED